MSEPPFRRHGFRPPSFVVVVVAVIVVVAIVVVVLGEQKYFVCF